LGSRYEYEYTVSWIYQYSIYYETFEILHHINHFTSTMNNETMKFQQLRFMTMHE